MPKVGVGGGSLNTCIVHRDREREVVDFGQNGVGSHHAENSVEGNDPVRCILVCVMNYFPYFYVWGDQKSVHESRLIILFLVFLFLYSIMYFPT